MKKIIYFFLLSLLSVHLSAQYTVSGGIGDPIPYTDNVAGTGVKSVYVLNTLMGATITYSSSASVVNFYRYEFSLADKVKVSQSDIMTSTSGGVTTYTVMNLIDSRGYLAEVNGATEAAIWIIDYTKHQPVLSSIEAIEDQDRCEYLKLFINKSDDLSFNATNGTPRKITRKYTIHYNDLVWSTTDKKFVSTVVNLPASEIGTEKIITPPLIDTKFTIRGDQFGEKFSIPKITSSVNTYNGVRVEGHIIYEQEQRGAQNEKPTEGELGGSAPVHIRFYGRANEPTAYFYTWFLYTKSDPNNAFARYTDRDIEYTFNKEGDYIVKLEVADRNSVCIDTASVTFNVSDFFLDIPNYFSPGTSPGSNDEFRVAYRSIIKFKCTIFNRWGTKIYQFTDPAKGWDGRYKGNLVNPGVYFYVIEATGSDGKTHRRSGDINILRGR